MVPRRSDRSSRQGLSSERVSTDRGATRNRRLPQRDFAGAIALARVALGFPTTVIDQYSWGGITHALADIPTARHRDVVVLAKQIESDVASLARDIKERS